MARWGTFFLGFLVAAAYWPGMLSAVFVPRWAAIAVFVPLLFRLDPRNLPVSLRWLLIFITGASALSILGALDRLAAIKEMIFILVLAATLIAGSGLKSLDHLVFGLAAGLAISSAMVIPQIYGWNGLPRTSGGPVGLFFNSEVMAEFAALILVWGIVRRNGWIVAASILPVMFCQSRVAWLAVAVALVWAYWPKPVAARMLLVCSIGLAAVAAIFLMGIDKMVSADHRIVLWIATIMAFEPMGNGLGWFQAAHPIEQFAHSDVLQAIAEIGYGAAAIFVIPFIILREKGFHAERAVFVAVCVEALVSFPLHLPATGFVAAVVSGYLLGRGRLVRVGVDHRRVEDGGSLQRPDAAGGLLGGAGRRGGGAVSLRSLPAGRPGLRLRAPVAHGGR